MKKRCIRAFLCYLFICILLIGADVAKQNMPKIDYSQYVRKIWVVKGWDDWAVRGYDNPSFRIDRIEDGRIEGRFELACLADGQTQNFEGMINDGVAECKFYTDNFEGDVLINFQADGEIAAEIKYGRERQNYLFRPYNLVDESYFILDEEQSFWTNLDSWGNIYFAVGIMDAGHPYPCAFLVNENHDIFFDFISGNWKNGTEVYEVFIEDINGDELKDVRMNTCFSNQPDLPHLEKIFLQDADGFFECYTNDGINKVSNERYELCYKSNESYATKEIRVDCSLQSIMQNGALYLIDAQEELPLNCFPVYLYVQDDRIYRIRMTSEEIGQAQSDEKIIENGVMIYREGEEKTYSYEDAAGFWEEFYFSEWKKLMEYRCGYKTSENVLELELIQ